MTKKEAFKNINQQKGLKVLTQKNGHFANLGDYHGRHGWWINIPFKKFADNLYLVLSNKVDQTFVLIEILAHTIKRPEIVFRTKDDDADIFIIETDNGLYIDVQSSGTDYQFSGNHKIHHYQHTGDHISLDILEYEEHFDQSLKKSLEDGQSKRLLRLKKAPKLPEKIEVVQTQFKRNPDVIVEVLKRADGVCERCKINAPFIRKKDSTPYLEVHHKVRLIDDGEDTIENAIAVCPNCHRELHYG
jgi:hypothetical protein